jgi:hypothetical protein
VPIWYDYDIGGELWFITGKQSRKGRLIEPDSRVSLAAQTEAPPYKYVSIEGSISAIEPATDAALLAMAVRYLGEQQGKAYAAGSGTTGQITVRIRPERWLAVDYAKS